MRGEAGRDPPPPFASADALTEQLVEPLIDALELSRGSGVIAVVNGLGGTYPIDDPQSTRAWEQGAIGEELLAARMKDLPETSRVLHDRRVPGTRANIDHIIVAPSGVWVVDAKRYKGRPALQVDGGIFRPRVESLRVAGRDKTKLVAGVQTQVERVATAVNDPTVPVTGALCFIEADWPLIGGSFIVNGVHVLWPRLLVKRLTTVTETDVDVDAVATRLAGAFPRAA